MSVPASAGMRSSTLGGGAGERVAEQGGVEVRCVAGFLGVDLGAGESVDPELAGSLGHIHVELLVVRALLAGAVVGLACNQASAKASARMRIHRCSAVSCLMTAPTARTAGTNVSAVAGRRRLGHRAARAGAVRAVRSLVLAQLW